MQSVKKRNKRITIIILAAFAIIASSIGTFAYWDSLSASKTTDAFEISNGTVLTIDAATYGNVEGRLIPKDAIRKVGDVTEMTVTFKVLLKEDAIDATGAVKLQDKVVINYEATNVTVDGSAENAKYVKITPVTDSVEVAAGKDVEATITFKVELISHEGEAISKTAYDAIKNKDIKFEAVFNVVVAA